MKQKTLTMQKLYQEGIQSLKEAGIQEAELDAWYLLEFVTGIGRAYYYARPSKAVADQDALRYRKLLGERRQRIPLQHLTGQQEFMGLPFLVNDQVLVPRQDTEILAEQALSRMKEGDRVLDMCTGSGCILLSLLELGPKAYGVGADLMEGALLVARENARRLGVEASFVRSDLFAAFGPGEMFDLIVSNPPYIPTGELDKLEPEVKCHDPRVALDGREDGLFFYRRIVEESVSRLKKGGFLLFETGCGQAAAVSALMQAAGFCQIVVKKDLAGLDRVVEGRL